VIGTVLHKSVNRAFIKPVGSQRLVSLVGFHATMRFALYTLALFFAVTSASAGVMAEAIFDGRKTSWQGFDFRSKAVTQ
jgi:hypothetical protein